MKEFPVTISSTVFENVVVDEIEQNLEVLVRRFGTFVKPKSK